MFPECVVKRDTFKAVGPHHGSPMKDDPYLITQIFDQPCLSAGNLVIRPRAVKPEQLVNTNAVVSGLTKQYLTFSTSSMDN